MKYEDLIEGEIYVQTSNYDFIFYYRKMENKTIGYGVYMSTNGNFYPAISLKNHNGTNYHKVRTATELEKAWLRECIKQNKFVPLENIKLIQNDWLWTI